MAAVAGGLAMGVLGSRLLPPLVAGATGSVRARLGQDPFERLRHDHRHILSILDQMSQAPDDSTTRRMPLFLSLKRTLGKHALAEEDVVYPLLHEDVGAIEATRQLYREHAEMKIHLYEPERTLKSDASWAERVRSLRDLVARHVRDEEDVQFPKLQQLMDERRSRTVSGQIHREEAMIL
jgi:hemerythrin superfamily protein